MAVNHKKVVLLEIKERVRQLTGSLYCAGLTGASESVYKAITELYSHGKSVLVLDVEGACNNLIRSCALKTIARVIPD